MTMTRFSAAHHAPGSGTVKAVPPRPAPPAPACGDSALTEPSARRYMAATETTGRQDQPTGSLHGYRGSLQAAMKCLYLVIMSLDPTGKGRQRWTNRWKAALNAFDITFDGRLSTQCQRL